MSDLDEMLWDEYLDEARKFYPRIAVEDGLKDFIRGDIGARISTIDSRPDGPQRTASIAGAKVCVRTGGYVSAMFARAEQGGGAITLKITEQNYRDAFKLVHSIFHDRSGGHSGDDICP